MNVNWIGFATLIKTEVDRFVRIAGQTILSPLITAWLYVFIFGVVVGTRIESIHGFAYVDFALPGILLLSLVTTAFAQSSTSLYFKRFAKHIEELLVAPISNGTIIAGFMGGAMIRGVVVSLGVLLVAVMFGAANFANLALFLLYVVSIASIFSLLGIVIGLWAKGFEQLNVLGPFVITPLSFLGGIFYSVEMLPSIMQSVVLFNPMFYFVDGIRFSMIGYAESNLLLGAALIAGLNVFLFWLVWYLFRIGYGIRD